MTATLRVHSIFESISGEAGGFPQGTWATFIRLQGCNLANPDGGRGCRWCDTGQTKAWGGGNVLDVANILPLVNTRHVLITGGEPLAQRSGLFALLQGLAARDHIIQVETNGSLAPLIRTAPPVYWVVDDKPPSSGVSAHMAPITSYATWARDTDDYGGKIAIKWVVRDLEDLHYALGRMQAFLGEYGGQVPFLLSPIDGDGSKIRGLVDVIKGLDPELLGLITFSVQLHKLIDMP